MAFDPSALSDEDRAFIARQQAHTARVNRRRLVATGASTGVLLIALLPWFWVFVVGRFSITLLVVGFAVGLALAIPLRRKLHPEG